MSFKRDFITFRTIHMILIGLILSLSNVLTAAPACVDLFNTTNKSAQFSSYFQKAKLRPPNALLVKALSIIEQTHLRISSAIDIGAGTGRDTRLLADFGLEVQAIDKDPTATRELRRMRRNYGSKVKVSSGDFSQVQFGKTDLVNAQWSLFFAPRKLFYKTWTQIVRTLKPGGLFVGNFIGPKDDWSKQKIYFDKIQEINPDPSRKFDFTSVTKQELEVMFKDFEILDFKEKIYQGPDAKGNTKNWHVYEIIALKK